MPDGEDLAAALREPRQRELSTKTPPAERYSLLREQGILRDYLGHQRDRLTALYRRVAERVREVKPDFIFSAYPGFSPDDPENDWRASGTALGLHSASAPFFVIDASHYGVSHTVPWWDTSRSRIRKLGMKHILGSYTATVYGHHPERAISAEQWMYEAAMSHDGYWLWNEHRFGPTDYAVFRAAERRIAEVENRVGDLLVKGNQDNTSLCLVEQSGNPARSKFLRQRCYHHGDRHLAWVFNANGDHRVQVLVRMPRLPKGRVWSVTEARSGLPYTMRGCLWRPQTGGVPQTV